MNDGDGKVLNGWYWSYIWTEFKNVDWYGYDDGDNTWTGTKIMIS